MVKSMTMLFVVFFIAISFGGTIPGDVNFDSDINVLDLTIASRIITGRYVATDYQKRVVDMNHDKVVSNDDLELITREVMK